MATLAADVTYSFSEEVQTGRDAPVITADTIYKHAAVGVSGGYARPLAAGDKFQGFAVEQVVNAGASGAKYVSLYIAGAVELSISAAAVTDQYKAVFASDDNTFTFTEGSNSFIGVATRWLETGKMLVEFDASRGGLGAIIASITDSSGGTDPGDDTIAAVTNISTLTDSTGGTASTTLAATGDTSGSDQSGPINNNFAQMAVDLALQKTANTAILAAIAQLAAKYNSLVKRLND